MIHLGEPESNLDDYKKYSLENITLYYPKKLESEREEIIISVSKLLKWKKLTLDGY